MDNGTVGCVEAVGKIGGFYSPFLAKESQNGVAYVPTLVSDANKAGVSVVQYAQDKVQKGDLIVYGDNDHVVISDGKGGYYGNSSNQNKVIHGNDYNQMDGLTPTQIIKTSQNATSSDMQTVSAYDPQKFEAYKNIAHEAVTESKIAYSNNLQQKFDTFDEWIKNNSNVTGSEIEQRASDMGFAGGEWVSAVGKAKQILGFNKSFTNQQLSETFQNAQDDVMAGNIRTPAEIDAKYGSVLPPNKLMMLKNSFKAYIDPSFQQPPEMQAKIGEEAFKAGVADAGFTKKSLNDDDESFSGAMDSIRQKVTDMIWASRKNGDKVTSSDIRKWAKEQSTKTTISFESGLLGRKVAKEDYLFKVPSGSVYVEGKGYGTPIQD